MRDLLLPHAPELVAKVAEMAKDGDAAALRICLDRLIPPAKAKDDPVSLPTLTDSLADNPRGHQGARRRGTHARGSCNSAAGACQLGAHYRGRRDLETTCCLGIGGRKKGTSMSNLSQRLRKLEPAPDHQDYLMEVGLRLMRYRIETRH